MLATYRYAAIGVFLVLFGALCGYIGWNERGLRADLSTSKINAQIASQIAQQAIDSSDKTSAIADSIASSAASLKVASVNVQKISSQATIDYANARKQKPLPVDCVIDADRLRVIRAATASANAALAAP